MKMQMPHIDESDQLEEAQYINLAVHGVDSDSSSDSEAEGDDDSKDGVHVTDVDVGDVEMAGVTPLTSTVRKKRRPHKRGKKRSEDHNPVVFVADTVREVGGVVLGATSTVVDATTGLFTAAVAHTPIISKTVKAFVHRYVTVILDMPCCHKTTTINFLIIINFSGFWDCYIVVREFIHETLRKEMAITSPAKGKNIYFTGHSLGGVIACFAALDFTIYSKERIDKFNRLIALRYSFNCILILFSDILAVNFLILGIKIPYEEVNLNNGRESRIEIPYLWGCTHLELRNLAIGCSPIFMTRLFPTASE